jgi:hypothetical protein
VRRPHLRHGLQLRHGGFHDVTNIGVQ